MPTPLEQAAVEARAALAALCHDLEDPGSNALGALYLLNQATLGIQTQPDEATKVLAARDAQVLNKAADEIESYCPDHGDQDTARTACHCDIADEFRSKTA